MMTLKVRNVNEALPLGLWWLKKEGQVEESRNGKVKVMPYPVTTVYICPYERVLFDERRDCNPFFHLAECIWILAGSNELEWIANFNSNMRSFSDDGIDLNGAYGHRLQNWFRRDQILQVIDMLKGNRSDRRAVLTMWDPDADLGSTSKDIPCNTQIYLRVNRGSLDMQVNCRSNDIIWGAYGANAVHFSFLQEYLAWAIGVQIGTLYQVSFNYHIYEQHWPLMDEIPVRNDNDPYKHIGLYPVIDQYVPPLRFQRECYAIVNGGHDNDITSPFLRSIFLPMQHAWKLRKMGAPVDQQIKVLETMPDIDWRIACMNWIHKRRMSNVGE